MKIYKNLRNPFIIPFLFLLCFSLPVLAAPGHTAGPVTGQVVDENGVPLVGATVQLKGSNVVTTTDAAGNFTINVPDKKATLVITHVGFDKFEVAASDHLIIRLRNSTASLGDVVVIGYGTQKKVSVTGSVDKLSGAKTVDGRAALNTTQLLQGESPNLIIQQRGFVPNGGSFNINIRGTGTTGNNNPLIVIDGVIGGDMNTLNPNDIDNISVLKDAGSAAIYGSRSANGVILITTKKGKAGSRPAITYNGIFSEQHSHQQFQPVPEWRNAELKNLSLENSGKPDAYTDAQIQQFKTQGDGNWRLNTILHDAPQTNQNFSVSGGSPTNTYFLSFGYFDQESNLTKSLLHGAYGIQRYNLRLNQNITLNKFTLSYNLSYGKTLINEPSVGDPSGLIGDVFRAPLSDNFQDAQGRYLTGFVTSNGLDILRNGGYRYSNNDVIDGAITAAYAITPALKLRAVMGGNIQANAQLQRYVDLKYFPTGETNANRQTENNSYKSLQTNPQLLLEYTKSFGKHDVDFLVGAANESFKSEAFGVQKSLTDSLLGVPGTGTTVDAGTNLAGGGSFNSLTSTTETSLNSWFGRLSYAFNNKYFFDGTLRADESSNFPSTKRWGYFPSIGGSWRLTEEKFMKSYKEKTGELKLRSTWGILGNQSVNPYQYITTYNINSNSYGFNNTATADATQNLANTGLTWEKAATFDIGADASFFRGKLNISGDYFRKVTSDILAPRSDVPTLFGASFPTYNTSKVQVKGWELKITYATTTGAFNHNFSFNIADNLSKLLAYSYGQTENVFQREEFDFVHRVGYPVTVYQGYKTNGLYQNTNELSSYPKFAANTVGLGDWKFVDKNHDGVIDAKDKFVLGNPFPRYTFGFTYNVSYHAFDASVFIQGVLKRVELIRGELIEAYHFGNYGGTAYNTKPETDFWTPQNTGAKYPRLSEIGSAPNTNNFRTGSDMYLFNTAYARLKNIQIGYSMPPASLARIGIKRLRIYATAQNILTVSPLKFADPEGTEFGNNLDNTSGANSPRSYPTPVFYGMGLDVNF